ncbi:hypothetical protein B0H11DRAFT_2026044 [Mycena galericulata]|nr:hypothetical protein B0H11DRAFT_2026044 [Mycena galericulata]
MAPMPGPSLVGSVFERTATSKPSSAFAQSSSQTGFPQVLHRSKKSAFARAREANAAPRDHVPVVAPSPLAAPPPLRKPADEDTEDWRAQISRENELRVAAMTDAEREQERAEILEKFGPGIGDLLKKVREARAKTGRPAEPRPDAVAPPGATTDNINDALEEVPLDSSPRSKSPAPRGPLPPALSLVSRPTSTRPASRAERKLRFAEVSPDDVHVYESAPPSPRRKALALPAPPAAGEGSGDVVSLGQWSGSLPAEDAVPDPDPEEGTPEYIRRRFFPSAPAHNPDLAWMMEDPPPPASPRPAPPALRFDLTGMPLASPLHASLPTHLGLHHHAPDADGVQRAGYTLDDVFLTSRSGVKAQRAAGMRMLAGIARWVGAVHRGDTDLVPGTLKVADIPELKARVLAAGIDALGERGSLGAHAIEVVWECVVGWSAADEALDLDVDTDMGGVELGKKDSAFPLAHLLPQLVIALSMQTESPSDLSSSASQTRILAILRRLARQTNDIATEIVSTPALIPALFRTFLLTGAPSSLADTALALDLLTTLATASRANAQALAVPADALLRFVTTLPPAHPDLLAGTLAFYNALAAYGLYAHIAATAHGPLAALATYVCTADADRGVQRAWADLLGAWAVCAADPHQTTPGHDILWSQVVAGGWGADVLALRGELGVSPAEWVVWAAVWCAEAAWLEGARVNGVRGGETERAECVVAIKTGFETDGRKESAVVKAAAAALVRALNDFGRGGAPKLRLVGQYAETLAAAIRLWLACLPPAIYGPLASPPFTLPFAQLSELCAKVVTHPLWSRVPKSGPGYVLFRPLSGLLSAYLRLSQRLPDVSQDVWMAQALSILSRLLPGDEEFALAVTQEILALITSQWALSRGLNIPQAVWDKGGVAVIKPFLVRAIRPRADIHIGPTWMSPTSIKAATTLRLPAPSSSTFSRDYGLPVARDWTLSPLDHLLRSGTSPVFDDLPAGWDASEVDVTRAALLLTKISRELSSRFSFVDFLLTRDEVVFGCMKVFMLEHGQAHDDSAEEVFRDRVVGQLMDDLLAPFTVAASSAGSIPPLSPVIPSPPSQPDLEQVAVRFLGAGTPFYQYYTDFVALYDAISFSHPTFARLLLPATSMRYAPDYRRHLWNDFSHVLKSIRTSPEDIIAADLGEYLWPVETDPQMIGAYLRALVKIPLQGFVRLLAVHHVAYNIWPGLRESTAEPATLGADRAEKLLKVVIDQGALEIVAEVLRYQQTREGLVSVPPECFGISQEVKSVRLEYVERVGGNALSSRVKGLLR